jgi:hypothetical protein
LKLVEVTYPLSWLFWAGPDLAAPQQQQQTGKNQAQKYDKPFGQIRK